MLEILNENKEFDMLRKQGATQCLNRTYQCEIHKCHGKTQNMQIL